VPKTEKIPEHNFGHFRSAKQHVDGTWHCPHSPAAAIERRPCSSRSISRVRRTDSSKPAAVGLLLLWSQGMTLHYCSMPHSDLLSQQTVISNEKKKNNNNNATTL